MALKILSLNVRGLGEVIKRRSIFNYYRTRGDIICLQETHTSPEVEVAWTAEWRGDILFSHGTNKARGICVLMPKGMLKETYNRFIDKDGQIIKFEIKVNDVPLLICAIYAPNEDKPHFFAKIAELCRSQPENIMLIGDFNLVMDNNLDRIGPTQNKPKSTQVLKQTMEELILCNAYRVMYPDNRRYSWYRLRPKLSASRIDYAIMSQGLMSNCENCGYITGIHSDHLAFFCFLLIRQNPRGKGYWKLNTTYLRNTDYIEMINEESSSLTANMQLDIVKKWEYMKYRVREITRQYSKEKISEREIIIAQLSEKVNSLETEMNEEDQDLLIKTKTDLEEMLMEKAKSCIFRSKCAYYELGERPTSYFFGIKKSKYNARTCHAVYDETSQKTVTDTEGILKLQYEFYTDLYSRDESVHFNLNNEYNICISEEIKLMQQSEILSEEVAQAIKGLPNNKTTGNDGIPIDFCKVFWSKLKPMYMELIDEVYKRKELHNTALSGVINLILKKQNTKMLKLMRPITLLNSDYKILEKVIANRIEPGLDEIINEDQRGFQKNRQICSNIRMIFELIKHTEDEDLDAMILSLDFMKCFDRIEFDALFGALKFFGIAEKIIDWTKILYKNFKANTQNNGFFSKQIKIGRGLHQGGPCSSIYFLICAEMMALLLRNDVNIKGIWVKEIKNLLGQYADDADIYLLKNKKSLDSVFLCLERFRSISGFTVNYDKTKIMRIGSLKNSIIQ